MNVDRIKKCLYCMKEYRCSSKMGIGVWSKRKYCSNKCVAKATKGILINEKHPLWKGEKVGYWGLHYWISRKLGKPEKCEQCGIVTAKKYEWANISKKYRRDLSDWIRLCASCHRRFDENWKKRTRDQLGRFI